MARGPTRLQTGLGWIAGREPAVSHRAPTGATVPLCGSLTSHQLASSPHLTPAPTPRESLLRTRITELADALTIVRCRPDINQGSSGEAVTVARSSSTRRVNKLGRANNGPVANATLDARCRSRATRGAAESSHSPECAAPCSRKHMCRIQLETASSTRYSIAG